MKLSQEPWTLEYLTALPDHELDRVGKRVAGDVVISRLHAGRVMLAMESTGLPARLGLSGAIHYFILAGFKRVEALECRRVAQQCEPLPKISAAAEAGTVSARDRAGGQRGDRGDLAGSLPAELQQDGAAAREAHETRRGPAEAAG
jgi:hypothetical protein